MLRAIRIKKSSRWVLDRPDVDDLPFGSLLCQTW